MDHQIECVRKVTFCAGHRILGHEGKCANIHGHNYTVYLHAMGQNLDASGRVVDFSVIKDEIGGWIDENWDHTFLAYDKDSEVIKVKNIFEANKKMFICPFNPTAENLALYLIKEICPMLLSLRDITITKIELHETENCKVIVYNS